ncbi:MAG: molybdopterin converting factor subunit 1 [Lautropia sp.]|nr:MAG: molybdopterin converting factor subunit 1 [Pseudomonadota bacterium]MBC6960976.1 molybdopterin converting factor subunit 1 [Lautropia sp.]MCL4701198.1 molybdopterin converting factor subunit 1 [Burkholderiaceae bacterium]MDL1907630.1 molybdopterin converting factor subunit 1 [Betaproteobacteria bacterium PRO1]RIK86339.1 MAG: molybdopterin converting factor subunit 1 [Burkholderiales bacterium]
MTITILYFAGLREALGTHRETIDLPVGVSTAAQLRAWLCGRGGAWAEMLAEGRAIRVSIDQAMARPDTPVGSGAEVAFFPPVTGG